MYRSMARSSPSSSGETNVKASPVASARAAGRLGLDADEVEGLVDVDRRGCSVRLHYVRFVCRVAGEAGVGVCLDADDGRVTAHLSEGDRCHLAQRVAGQMPRELRCTALGGLSITKTSLAIEEKLAAKKAAPCGAPICGCAR